MSSSQPVPTPWQRFSVALRGLIYSSAFVLLWTWLAVSVRPHDPRLPFTIPSALRIAGIVVAVAGALLTVSCIATFIWRGRGTPAPFDPPRDFVASGPYRWVRNPMYLGAATVLVGAGLVVGSPAIVVLAAFFLLVTHLFVVLYEEPALTSRFGESYLRYRATVDRWRPRLPSRIAPPRPDR